MFRNIVAVSLIASGVFAAADAQKMGDLGRPVGFDLTMRRSADVGSSGLVGLPALPSAQIPTAFNWKSRGFTTPSKDQQYCGSCWAFATVGSIESKFLLKGWGTYDFSEEQQIARNTVEHGCNGGNIAALQFYISEQPMLESQTAYPDASCDAVGNGPWPNSLITSASLNAYKRTDMQNLDPTSFYTFDFSDQMIVKNSVLTDGPAVLAFPCGQPFINWWNSAASGIVYSSSTDDTTGHAVLLIGWDDSKGAWLCKNSWGANSGPNRDGTFWIAYTQHVFADQARIYSPNFFIGSNAIVRGGGLWACLSSSSTGTPNIETLNSTCTGFVTNQGVATGISGDPRGLAISINQAGNVWAITRTGGWVKVGVGTASAPLTPPAMTQITQAWNGTTRYVYATDAALNIYVLSADMTTWTKIYGLAAAIDVDNSGAFWAVGHWTSANRNSTAWKVSGSNAPWVDMSFNLGTNTPLLDIASDGGSNVFVVDATNKLWQLNSAQTAWTQVTGTGLPAAVKKVDVDMDGVYVLSTAGYVFRRLPGQTNWTQIGTSVMEDIGCSSYN